MGIPYIGMDPNTLEAISSLGRNIGRVVNPDYEQQRRFQQESLMRPEILQQLADINAYNPGFAKQFGSMLPPHIADVIGRMQPSSDAVLGNAERNLSPELLRRGAVRRVTGSTPEAARIGGIQERVLAEQSAGLEENATPEEAKSLVFPLDSRLDAQRDAALARFSNQRDAAAARQRFDEWRTRYGAGEAMRRTLVMADAANGREYLRRNQNDTRELDGYQQRLSTAMRNYSIARDSEGRTAARVGIAGAIASINSVRTRYGMPTINVTTSTTGRWGPVGNRLSIINEGTGEEVDENDIGAMFSTELPNDGPVTSDNPASPASSNPPASRRETGTNPARTTFRAGSNEAGALAQLVSARNKTQAMAQLRQGAPTIAQRVIDEYNRLYPTRQ